MVDPGDALIILGQFLAGLNGVGEKCRDGQVFGLVKDFVDTVVRLPIWLIAKEVGLEALFGAVVFSASAVGIGGGKV